MRVLNYLVVATAAAAVTSMAWHAASTKVIEVPQAATPGVCFNPESRGGCEQTVVQELGNAQHQILMFVYRMTEGTEIPAALITARRRGVDVRILMDRGAACGHSAIPVLDKAGIDIRIDPNTSTAHIKALIVDGHTVISGSANWTLAARHNSEDQRLDRDPELAAQYARHWQHQMAKAPPYIWDQDHSCGRQKEGAAENG